MKRDYSTIFNNLRIAKRKLGAAQALLTYAKTRKEIKAAKKMISERQALVDNLQSHFEYA